MEIHVNSRRPCAVGKKPQETPLMEIENFFPYQVAVAAASLSRRLEEVYRREGGLSREEWRVLFLLAEEEGLTSKALSQRSSLDKVQISRAAQRLEKKGLIVGSESGQDRRLRDYTCTDAGRQFFRDLFPRVDSRAGEVLARLSPDDLSALKQGIAALSEVAREDG